MSGSCFEASLFAFIKRLKRSMKSHQRAVLFLFLFCAIKFIAPTLEINQVSFSLSPLCVSGNLSQPPTNFLFATNSLGRGQFPIRIPQLISDAPRRGRGRRTKRGLNVLRLHDFLEKPFLQAERIENEENFPT